MEPVLGVGRSLAGRRWVWRVGEDRVGLGIAQRMGVPEIVGRLSYHLRPDECFSDPARTERSSCPGPCAGGR